MTSLLRARWCLSLALGLGIAGCSSAPAYEEEEEEVDEGAIINGTKSGAEDDGIVLISVNETGVCSGTVIAPNVVLTAAHCVMPTKELKVIGPAFDVKKLNVFLGNRFEPSVTSVAAVGVESIVPEGMTIGASIVGRDVALLMVQALDPAFTKVKPRALRATSVRAGEKITGVGWGFVDQTDKETHNQPLERRRRTGVEVLAGSNETTTVRSSVGVADETSYSNVAGTIATSTVACQGDSGGPALDASGAIAGVSSFIMSPGYKCLEGAVSFYVDVWANRTFIQSGLERLRVIGCLDDTACGVGNVCDGTTRACVAGCRVGGTGCRAGVCNAPSAATGTVGWCSDAPPSATPTPTPTPPPYDPNDPYADPYGDPYGTPPTPPPVASTPECNTDVQCNPAGVATGEPRICERQKCVAGCRVNDPKSSCGQARICSASASATGAGSCQPKPVQPAAPLPTPVIPGVSDAPAAPAGAAGNAAADTSSTKKKKSTAAAPAEEGGCTVTAAGSRGIDGRNGLTWALLALAAAATRRSRRRAA